MALNIQNEKTDAPNTQSKGMHIPDLKKNPAWPKLRDRILEYLECVYLYDTAKSYILGFSKVGLTKAESFDLSLLTQELVRVHQHGAPAQKLRDTLHD